MSQTRKRAPAGDIPERHGVPVVAFVSLGCVKNLVDSEKMLAQVAETGAVLGDESIADTVVVNTCGFLGTARQEALDVLRGLAQRKRRGTLQRIIVAGCLAQRDGTALCDAIPEIDALVGVNNRDDLARVIWPPSDAVARGAFLDGYHAQPWSDQCRLRLTPQHYAYVRISEGCDQKCTFCTIPAIRGPLHCKTPEALAAECQEMIADGARELILIGQDTTSYGKDSGYEPGLAGLLRHLDRVCDGARWLRLMYAYPSELTEAMIDALAECARCVKYVDLPLQHINDRILRTMGRRVTRAQTETLLARLRQRIPGLTIRTTFMVGFPGETAAGFDELLRFVRDFRFDAVGAFTFSREPETPAGSMPAQIDGALARQRYDRLMQTQQEIAFAAARQRVGQCFDVVVDESHPGRCVARHAGQAPEVDSVCLLRGGQFPAGEQLRVRCTDTSGYDLVVEPQP
jgi:ribosomal protein S12 methylthiotransferase